MKKFSSVSAGCILFTIISSSVSAQSGNNGLSAKTIVSKGNEKGETYKTKALQKEQLKAKPLNLSATVLPVTSFTSPSLKAKDKRKDDKGNNK
jgi:uncharacterized membrane protein